MITAGTEADYVVTRDAQESPAPPFTPVPSDAPDRELDRTIAHLLMTAENNLAHCDVHLSSAQAAKSPASLVHNIAHSQGHIRKVSDHLTKLRVALTRRVPAVGEQLDKLDAALPVARAAENVPLPDLDQSLAHDLASAQVAAGHVDRHLSAVQESHAAGDTGAVKFGLTHGEHHVQEISHHLAELHADLVRKLPGVEKELGLLSQVTGRAGTGRSAKPADYDVITLPDNGPQPA